VGDNQKLVPVGIYNSYLHGYLLDTYARLRSMLPTYSYPITRLNRRGPSASRDTVPLLFYPVITG